MTIISALPYNFTPGTTAVSSQVNANFSQIVSNVNANAAASGANSDITSILGLTTPLSAAQGGSTIFVGGTSTGSANAQVIATLVPNSFALTSGNTAKFYAGFTNSGAATLNLNSTGIKTIKKIGRGGYIDLVANDIIVSTEIEVLYDGTYYILINPALGTSAFQDIATLAVSVGSLFMPVGSVYVNYSNATNPATLLGFGTWTAMQDSFLIGAGGTYAAGTTGGATTHTLTAAEVPVLTYTAACAHGTDGGTDRMAAGSSANGSPSTVVGEITSNAGGGAHSILNPYIAVYMWRRTA